MSENEHPSDVSSRVTADDQSLDLDNDADLEAQREVFLAMIDELGRGRERLGSREAELHEAEGAGEHE